VRELIATLTLTEKQLSGAYANFGKKDDGRPLVLFTVDANVNGESIEGKCRATIPLNGTSFEGAVNGKIISEAELQGVNSFSGKADWSCWTVPTQSRAATPCGLKLIDNLATAKLL
jgi:hypothetical protein